MLRFKGHNVKNSWARWALPAVGMTLVMVALSIVFVSVKPNGISPGKVLIGHNGSPLLAFYYAAGEGAEGKRSFSSAKFNSSADVGYALLSGSIHAGFIEPEKAIELSRLSGFEKLVVLGKVTFPYGVTVITKKGSSLRLQDINGLNIAVPSDHPDLFDEFIKAVSRYPVILNKISYRFLPSDAIIPALEAGKIDGAIVKGSKAVVAISEGHNILFQKWDMAAGNECCPPVIEQLEFVLLAQKNDLVLNTKLIKILNLFSASPPSVLRNALSRAEHVSETLFADLPLASFEPADNKLLSLFARHSEPDHQALKKSSCFLNR
jgi:hypothetical protein